jgi:GPI mannosyltransferase 1 subunit M
MFLQTFVFVIFNKVCTVQYFLWYVCLLPLVLPRCYIQWYKYVGMGVMWFITQGFWLYFAYELEFLGNQTFMLVWFGSILFFMANLWILCELLIGRAIYWNWMEHRKVKQA